MIPPATPAAPAIAPAISLVSPVATGTARMMPPAAPASSPRGHKITPQLAELEVCMRAMVLNRFAACSGFTPWPPQGFQAMLGCMDNKTWLIEAEFAAYLVAAAIVAFTLMVGHTLWRSLVRN